MSNALMVMIIIVVIMSGFFVYAIWDILTKRTRMRRSNADYYRDGIIRGYMLTMDICHKDFDYTLTPQQALHIGQTCDKVASIEMTEIMRGVNPYLYKRHKNGEE